MSFPNVVHGSEGDLFHDSATEDVPVGTLMITEDGRKFRFTEMFTTGSVVGSLYQAEVHLYKLECVATRTRLDQAELCIVLAWSSPSKEKPKCHLMSLISGRNRMKHPLYIRS